MKHWEFYTRNRFPLKKSWNCTPTAAPSCGLPNCLLPKSDSSSNLDRQLVFKTFTIDLQFVPSSFIFS